MKTLIFFSLAICLSVQFISCSKESVITSPQARLSVSSDTLSYDTVFTSVGSVTQAFKIFNDNSQKLFLSKVKLAGGSTSFFKLNVDGISANEVEGIEINANDSIYIFVQVKIDPTNAMLPFVIRDSILISYNGNEKFVQLQAYGQNAIFLKSVKLTGQVAWSNILPYVILEGILIDSNAVLNITEGTKIFMHADAPFLVDGTLKVSGTKDQRVIFAGDRLDPGYKDFPAGWPGIYFSGSSKENNLEYTTIKNAYQGVIAQDPSSGSTAKVTLSKCIIDNVYDAGIFGINTSIAADNCLVSNCGKNIQLILGGNYSFVNCTVASFGNYFLDHKDPVLQATNFFEQNGTIYTSDLSATFTNCIFWGAGGSVENEVVLNKKPGASFNATFNNTLYKVKDNDPADGVFTGNKVKNLDPLFDSIDVAKNFFDFHLQKNAASPALDKGVVTGFSVDLDGETRLGVPDLGCYEKQ